MAISQHPTSIPRPTTGTRRAGMEKLRVRFYFCLMGQTAAATLHSKEVSPFRRQVGKGSHPHALGNCVVPMVSPQLNSASHTRDHRRTTDVTSGRGHPGRICPRVTSPVSTTSPPLFPWTPYPNCVPKWPGTSILAKNSPRHTPPGDHPPGQPRWPLCSTAIYARLVDAGPSVTPSPFPFTLFLDLLPSPVSSLLWLLLSFSSLSSPAVWIPR